MGDCSDLAVLEEVLTELLAREPIFHRPELGTALEDYLAQTAEDYWEVGASGRVYEREGVIEGLLERGKVPGDEHWVVSDPHCGGSARTPTPSPTSSIRRDV